jgi:hypothetical protein
MSAEEPETEAGPANDATEVVDDDFSTRLRNVAGSQAESQEAWSNEDDAAGDAESENQPWSVVTGQAAALLSVGAAVAAVIAVLGWMMLHKDRPAASAGSSLAMPTNNAALSPSPIPLTTSAETARTQIITAVAVDASGQPAMHAPRVRTMFSATGPESSSSLSSIRVTMLPGTRPTTRAHHALDSSRRTPRNLAASHTSARPIRGRWLCWSISRRRR